MNDDVYVRKDTLNETMKRIEAMMAASEARHREYAAKQDAQIAEIRGEVKELRAIVDGQGDPLAAYVQSFSARSSFWQGVLGAVIGFCAVAVACVQVYLALRG